MKWFDKWFYKQAKKAWQYKEQDVQHEEAKIASSNYHSTATIGVRGQRLGQNSMDFSVYTANGGYIVEYKSYDPKTDKYDGKLHIIPEDKELGEGISHIVTIEMLRR